tara:strand:- start:1790 stop:1966 length:177 start_codon:yes stop_codon:yes gene_type:complete
MSIRLAIPTLTFAVGYMRRDTKMLLNLNVSFTWLKAKPPKESSMGIRQACQHMLNGFI